jgi:predicted nucleic acid-binding protein
MAGKSRQVIRAYVLDTSYLLEIYRVPGHSDVACYRAIKPRLRAAIKADARLYVPFPVIFELANHIAHVADGGRRISLAKKLSDDISKSAQEGIPWIIAPVAEQSVLLELSGLLEWIEDFERNYATQGLGLSDLAVTKQANSLASRHPHLAVHIWTTDHSLKAQEPQAEPDAFVGA